MTRFEDFGNTVWPNLAKFCAAMTPWWFCFLCFLAAADRHEELSCRAARCHWRCDAERSSQDEAEIRCPAAGRFVEMAILLKAVEKGDAIDRFDKIAPVKMMMQLAKNGYGYSGNG